MYGAQWSLPEVRTPAKLTISPVFQGFVRRPTFTVSTCSLPCRKCPVICSSETRRWHSWAGLSGGQNRPFCVNTLHSIHQHLVHFYWPHWRCARGVRKSWIRHGRRGNWRRNGGGFRISPEQTPPLATHRREDEEEECKGEVCRFHHLPASLSGGCSLICMSTDIAHMQTYRQGRCWGSNYEKLLSAESRSNPGDPEGRNKKWKNKPFVSCCLSCLFSSSLWPLSPALFPPPPPDISSLHTPTLLFLCVIIDSPYFGGGTLHHSWLDLIFLSRCLTDKKIRAFVNKASILHLLPCIYCHFCDHTCGLKVMTDTDCYKAETQWEWGTTMWSTRKYHPHGRTCVTN